MKIKAPVPEDFSVAIRAYLSASLPVWNDEAVWREEQASAERRLLPWPRPYEGTQFNRLLSVLFNSDVDVLLVLLKERDDSFSPAWPPSAHDPKMQALLRVVQRSMQAGEAAMVNAFGGERVTGRREYLNRVNDACVSWALASGLPRAEAFELVGVSRAGAYRAMHRPRRSFGA